MPPKTKPKQKVSATEGIDQWCQVYAMYTLRDGTMDFKEYTESQRKKDYVYITDTIYNKVWLGWAKKNPRKVDKNHPQHPYARSPQDFAFQAESIARVACPKQNIRSQTLIDDYSLNKQERFNTGFYNLGQSANKQLRNQNGILIYEIAPQQTHAVAIVNGYISDSMLTKKYKINESSIYLKELKKRTTHPNTQVSYAKYILPIAVAWVVRTKKRKRRKS